MGILKSLRKSRKKKKLEVAAAKARARQEVKSQAKLDYKREKLLKNVEKQLRKEEEKGLKAKRKHEMRMAKNELERRRAGRFNKDTVKRYAAASRVLAPLLLPVVYKLITALGARVDSARAAKMGLSPADLAQFGGHGAPLKARISGMRKSVSVSSLPKGFIRDVSDRLDELSSAVDNAENMTEEQRQRAHRSIHKELNQLARQIQDKITG